MSARTRDLVASETAVWEAPPMQFPRDWLAKGILQGAVDGPCRVHIEEQVTPEVLSLDAWVEPVPERARELDDRGLLGDMVRVACVVEAYHPSVSLEDVDWSMLRVTLLHDKRRRAVEKIPTHKRPPMPSRPWLWLVTTARPDVMIDAWRMEPIVGKVTGCYASVVERGPRLIVTPELPRTRDTILVRFMGAGEVLQRALDDLAALHPDAWERAVVEPLIALVRRDLARMGITVDLSERDPVHDFKVIQQAWELRKKELRAEGRDEGIKAGRDEGIKAGRAEGLRLAVHQFERRLGRPLTNTEQSTVVARFDLVGPDRLGDVVLDLNPDALVTWIEDPDAR